MCKAVPFSEVEYESQRNCADRRLAEATRCRKIEHDLTQRAKVYGYPITN